MRQFLYPFSAIVEPQAWKTAIVSLTRELQLQGHRADITILKAARAHAALMEKGESEMQRIAGKMQALFLMRSDLTPSSVLQAVLSHNGMESNFTRRLKGSKSQRIGQKEMS
jgi:Mg-chelatase subunit ChlI